MFPGSPFKSSSACNEIYFAISQSDFAKSVHRQRSRLSTNAETPALQNRHRVPIQALAGANPHQRPVLVGDKAIDAGTPTGGPRLHAVLYFSNVQGGKPQIFRCGRSFLQDTV